VYAAERREYAVRDNRRTAAVHDMPFESMLLGAGREGSERQGKDEEGNGSHNSEYRHETVRQKSARRWMRAVANAPDRQKVVNRAVILLFFISSMLFIARH
jgi:hypothetical protein